MAIETIVVIGTGAMDSGIVEVAAKAEVFAFAYDIDAGKARV